MSAHTNITKLSENELLRQQFTHYFTVSDRRARLTMKVPALLRRLVKKEAKIYDITMGRVLSETLFWVQTALFLGVVNLEDVFVPSSEQYVTLSTYVSRECYIAFKDVAKHNGLQYKDLMNTLLCKRYSIFDNEN